MLSALLQSAKNFIITVTLWVYYIMGFFVMFSPFYLYAFFFSPRREEVFQTLNHRLHRLFFSLLRTIVPKVKWRISDEVKELRSSIIIANHLSFLDPILFVSLLEKQKTIVKSDYFKLPVFGWILKTSGYIPSTTEGPFMEDMLDQIKKMKEYLAGGGNLFIFPEGTRSFNGRIGLFDKGAFRIAKLCNAPIKAVFIKNTGKLFPPGKFLFNTGDEFAIEVELAGTLEPDYESESFTLSGLMVEARTLMERKAAL
jgi:1-acyl-sn-glycerol-3-phosphate acyltransferase